MSIWIQFREQFDYRSEPHRMNEWPYNVYVLANHFGFPLLFVTVPSLVILYKNGQGIAKAFGLPLPR